MKAIDTFISHKWGDPSDGVVSELVSRLERIPHIRVYLDRTSLGYRANIQTFMNRLREGTIVVAVVCKEYLLSADCMFEISGLFDGNPEPDRLFPVLVDDLVRREQVQLSTYRFWKERITQCRKSIIENEGIEPYVKEKEMEIERIEEIINRLPLIFKYFREAKVLSLEAMRNEDYSSLIKEVVQKAKELLMQSQLQLRINIQIPQPISSILTRLLEKFKIDYSLVTTKGFDQEEQSYFELTDAATPINAVFYQLLSEIDDNMQLTIHYSSPKHQLEFDTNSIQRILNVIKYE